MDINAIAVSDTPTITILDLDGELDASNYLDVIARVRSLYESGTRHLVIDLTDVRFLSSSGLVALHSAALVMRGDEPPDPELGWSAFHAIATDVEQGFESCCKLANPQPRVRKSLEITGFGQFLEIFDDTDAAVASFLTES